MSKIILKKVMLGASLFVPMEATSTSSMAELIVLAAPTAGAGKTCLYSQKCIHRRARRRVRRTRER